MKLTAQNNTAFTDMSKLNMKPTAQSNNRELMWHQIPSNKELMKRVKKEINNQHNVQEGDSNSDTLGTNANRPVDTDDLTNTGLVPAIRTDGRRINPQDDSGAETSSAKEDNGNGTFPADSKSKIVILDDNELSLSLYAQEYPENFKAMTETKQDLKDS